MSRTIATNLLNALLEKNVEPFFAVELLFDSSPIRIWTGYGDKTVEGNTFTGAGSLLQIGGLEEVNDLSAKSVTLSLSGLPSSIVSLALDEPYQRRACKIYFGTDDTTYIEIFSGLMNTMQIQDDAETSTITVTVDSKLTLLERASNRRYTDANHQTRNPGDTFFSYVQDLADKDIIWGREKN